MEKSKWLATKGIEDKKIRKTKGEERENEENK